MSEKMKNVNWEKISIYLAILAFVHLLWTSQDSNKQDTSILRERVAKIEVKVEKLEEKEK